MEFATNLHAASSICFYVGSTFSHQTAYTFDPGWHADSKHWCQAQSNVNWIFIVKY